MRWTVLCVVCGSLLMSAAGCDEKSCEDGACPDMITCRVDGSEPDIVVAEVVTREDTIFEDTGGLPDECMMGVVACEHGETDIYGVCVADLEVLNGGGDFMMGDGDAPINGPEHEVSLSPFVIDSIEVTNRMYAACVTCGQCTPPKRDASYTGREPSYYLNPEFDDYPVVHVTWEQASQFCDGLDKSLPTEAQWEFAARGSHSYTYPWGDDQPTWQTGNLDDVFPDTTEVGSFEDGATPTGVYDLAGNVWEWTADTFVADYYSYSASEDPKAPEGEGLLKTVRGGSFGSDKDDARSFVRGSFAATADLSTVGFRCAK